MDIKANERCKVTNNAGGKNCMKCTFGLVFLQIKNIFWSEMLSYMWQPIIKPQLMSHTLKPSTPPSCCCSSQS